MIKPDVTPRAPSRRSNQRERLLEGMVAAVARHGYPDATIAHAIAEAHVSRSTFYEHFPDKETCFLAAYAELAERMTAQLQERVAAAPWTEKAGAMLASVLDPEEWATPRWRLLLSLARGGGPRVKLARARLVAELEEPMDELLDRPPPGAQTLDIPAKALLGGVRSVLSIRRYQDNVDASIREQLLAWARSYAIAAGRPRHSATHWNALGTQLASRLASAHQASPSPSPSPARAKRLPRGRSHLPAEIVSGEHHARVSPPPPTRSTARATPRPRSPTSSPPRASPATSSTTSSTPSKTCSSPLNT